MTVKVVIEVMEDGGEIVSDVPEAVMNEQPDSWKVRVSPSGSVTDGPGKERDVPTVTC